MQLLPGAHHRQRHPPWSTRTASHQPAPTLPSFPPFIAHTRHPPLHTPPSPALHCPALRCPALHWPQDSPLFNWLVSLYPAWATMSGEDAYISAKLSMAELLLSGCTCTSGE